MKYENWISLKYLTAPKDRFISVINFVSIFGIAIGVMALIVVIAVMTGFDNDLRDKIIGTNAHLVIEKETGVQNLDEIRNTIDALAGIAGSTPYIHGSIFLEDNGQAQGVGIRGVYPKTEALVTKVKDYLVKGKLDDLTGDGVILGSELAVYHGYELGDTVTVIAPASRLPRPRSPPPL